MTLTLWGGRRGAWAAGALVAAGLAAGCGGGTEVSKFEADRALAFGDESSLIVDRDGDGNGSKYGINGVVSTTDPSRSCKLNALWIQRVAGLYGLVFPQCNPGPTPVAAPTSRIRATLGATAADLSAQIDAQIAESAIRSSDIATVMVGVNDVFAQYAQYPAVDEETLTVRVEAAGAVVGQQVNRLADAGARVVVSTVIDAGVTPFGVAEKAGHTDIDRAGLLTRLSQRFNASLRRTIDNDGRRIGLVLLDELVSAVARFNGLNDFTNSTVGACDLSRSALVPPSVLDCTDLTLVTGASANRYLWADDRHLSAGGQASFGTLAIDRAEHNSF